MKLKCKYTLDACLNMAARFDRASTYLPAATSPDTSSGEEVNHNQKRKRKKRTEASLAGLRHLLVFNEGKVKWPNALAFEVLDLHDYKTFPAFVNRHDYLTQENRLKSFGLVRHDEHVRVVRLFARIEAGEYWLFR